ncbi:MAG: hypothetical protein U9N85_07315 [Bacteroidota bacterium]|nr:hypothetical protein [Bacteroidota bacterium]
MTAHKKNIAKRKVKVSDLKSHPRESGQSIHSFKTSKLPMSVSMAKKGPQLFNLTVK